MRENQRIALTKRLLQEGLLRLLKSKPMDKINVTELCKEAGINRATFYRHYEMPRDVLLEMQKSFADELYQFYRAPITEKDSRRYLEDFCVRLYENAELIKVFVHYNSLENIEELFSNILQDVIKQKDTIGALKSFDDASIKLITTSLAGGGYFLVREWLMQDIQKTPQEIADLIWRFLNREYTVAE